MKAKKKTSASRRLEPLRERAEALLEQSPRAVSETPGGDVQNLVHELRVHQAELEMQNEELRRVQLELEDSRDRFSDLYDFAPAGYVTLDARGTILEANLTAAKMLGVIRKSLVGQKLSRFVARDSEDALYLLCQEVFANDKPHACELVLRKSDGTSFPVHFAGVPFVDAAQTRRCHAAFSDITAQRQAEAAVRAREEQYRLLFELNPNPMWIFDEATLRFLAVNDAAVKLYGWSRAEFLRMTIKDIRPPEEVPKLTEKLARQRGSRAAFVGAWRHWKKDHTPLDVGVSISCIQYQGRDARLTMVNDVTGRKQAEEALRQSAEEWQVTFDGVEDAIFLLDAEQRVRRCNKAAVALFGEPMEKLLGRPCWEMMHGTSAPISECPFRRATRSRRRQSMELVLKDRWFLVTLDPLLDATGRLSGAVHILSDITERKRAAEALRESEANFRGYFENVAVGTAQIAPNGRFLRVNDRFCEITGYSRAELVGGMRPLDLDHPEERAADSKLIARFFRGEIPRYESEKRYVRKNRRVVWVRVSAGAVHDTAGRLLYTAGVIEDITERKRAEEALKQLNATLEQRVAERTEELSDAYERLRAITDSALVGILILNERGVIESLNPAVVKLFGHSPEEMLGRSVNEFMAGQDQRKGEEFLAYYTQSGDQRVLGIGREVLGRRKDRHAMCLELTVSDFTHGGQRRFVAMVRDITRRKRLERELLEVGERERQRLGHDLHDGLGQQLHALYYMASLFEREIKEASPERAREAGRLAKQLEHALELSRSLVRGLQPVNAVPEGLMAALRELAERTRQLYRVDCRFQCRAVVLIHRHAAANHLYRIAQEAVNNAMKHGRPTRILIKLTDNRQRIVLGIRDNGVGIHEHAGRARGMGLHIMQYRAGAINGSLVVQRPLQGGTEVVCTVTRKALLPQEEETK